MSASVFVFIILLFVLQECERKGKGRGIYIYQESHFHRLRRQIPHVLPNTISSSSYHNSTEHGIRNLAKKKSQSINKRTYYHRKTKKAVGRRIQVIRTRKGLHIPMTQPPDNHPRQRSASPRSAHSSAAVRAPMTGRGRRWRQQGFAGISHHP